MIFACCCSALIVTACSYFIVAGLVFTPATVPYLRSEYGKEYDFDAPVSTVISYSVLCLIWKSHDDHIWLLWWLFVLHWSSEYGLFRRASERW
jgi:hypothetical protein